MTSPLQDPAWSAARAALPGDSSAANYAAQIGQFLASHGITPIYPGAPAAASSTGTTPGMFYGTGGSYWPLNLGVNDFDQPFTLATGTTAGRAVLPVLPVGSGADLKVSLCADSSGSPGTVLASMTVPAAWISQFAAVSGTAAAGSPATQLTGNPLAVPQFNSLAAGPASAVPWPTPAASGAANTISPAIAVSGNYIVLAGGINASTSAVQAAVYTIAWQGGSTLGNAVPQPSLPAGQVYGALTATSDTLVYAGGGNTGTPYSTAVYTAPWDPVTGTAGAWSSQAAYPTTAHQPGGAASWLDTVYLVGSGASGPGSTDVYYAAVSNSQITAWHTGPALPQALSQPSVAAVGGYLVVAGGVNSSTGPVTTFYYSPINPDGSLTGWQSGPALPETSYSAALQIAVTSLGIAVTNQSDLLAIGMGSAGPGAWSVQKPASGAADTGWAAFSAGDGTWQMFTIMPAVSADTYSALTLYGVPVLSVPLPVTGLTNGATYHVLLQQQGGDDANYLASALDTPATSGTAALYRAAGSAGTWATYAAGQVIPLTLFDNSLSGGTLPWHLWEDSGARVTTLAWDTASGQLAGVAESTSFPAGAPEAVLPAVTGVDYAGSAWRPSGLTQLA